MDRAKRIGAFVIFIPLILSSCSFQANQGTSASNSLESDAASNDFTPTHQETRPPTEPAVVELEPGSTAIPSTLPTSSPDRTMEPENPKANADVIFVKARQESDDTWYFLVTVEHPDTGWEDYADGWDVVLPDGSVAKPDTTSPFTRLLLHPHETEQPFTRDQGGIVIEPGITEVTVKAHDLVDGFGGKEIVVDLMSPAGPGFEVQRLLE
jgi:hypothetical protein